MDYLLRDPYHAGVAHGRFDHFRLIDTIRILPAPAPVGVIVDAGQVAQDVGDAGELFGAPPAETKSTLGIDKGGLQSAEALLLRAT